jgi:hypothetical protein
MEMLPSVFVFEPTPFVLDCAVDLNVRVILCDDVPVGPTKGIKVIEASMNPVEMGDVDRVVNMLLRLFRRNVSCAVVTTAPHLLVGWTIHSCLPHATHAEIIDMIKANFGSDAPSNESRLLKIWMSGDRSAGPAS